MADEHMEQSGRSAEAKTPSIIKLLGGGCGGAIIGAVLCAALGALPGICVLVLALSAEPLEPNPDYTVDGTATVALLLIGSLSLLIGILLGLAIGAVVGFSGGGVIIDQLQRITNRK